MGLTCGCHWAGARLAAGGGNTAQIWDAATGREITRLAHDSWVNAVAYSPGGTRLATGHEDKIARIWDVATGREITPLPHPGWVTAAPYSPGATPPPPRTAP